MDRQIPERENNFLTVRLFGLEHEYAFRVVFADPAKSIELKDIAEKLLRPFGRGKRFFLSNGSRCYIDYNAHPEMATAENPDLRGLIAHVRAGDLIMEELIGRLEHALAAQGIEASVYLFKNNTDSAGNSHGGHENYTTLTRLPIEIIAAALGPFLATRQLFAGAGKVVSAPGGARYVLSQRADYIERLLGMGTVNARAAITRGREAHSGDPRYQRLHLIIGDSNMSEPTTMLKMGSTDLVLRMIEAGYRFPELRVSETHSDFGTSLWAVSRDLTGRGKVKLHGGATMTALEVQQSYLEQVQAFVAEHGFDADPQTAAVLELWTRSLHALETGNLELIARDIDWVIKKNLIDRYCRLRGVDLSDPRVADLDVRYHDVQYSPEQKNRRGLYRILEERGEVNRIVDVGEIQNAVLKPPISQAQVRSDFMHRGRAVGLDVAVNWEILRVVGRTDALRVASGTARLPQGGRLHLPLAVPELGVESGQLKADVVMRDPFSPTDAGATTLFQAMPGLAATPAPAQVRTVGPDGRRTTASR